MAYNIIGTVHQIGATEQLRTKTGGLLLKKTLILIQRRFDQNTGQEFEPNFPVLEFTNNNCAKLDHFKTGDKVRVSFDINGFKYIDRNTNAEKYSSSLRGFNVELVAVQQPQVQYPPQPSYQPAQPPYQGQPQYYPPQGQAPYPGQPTAARADDPPF